MVQPKDNYQPIAKNNKANFDYDIQETLEAGIVLQGTEVKSLRLNRASIAEGHVDFKDRNAYLLNVSILPYKFSKYQNHQPNRPRRLLLHRRQLDKLASLIKQKGMAIVPLSFYFNAKGLAKLTIGVAKGRKLYDKRAVIKQREHDLEKRRAIKEFR